MSGFQINFLFGHGGYSMLQFHSLWCICAYVSFYIEDWVVSHSSSDKKSMLSLKPFFTPFT